MDTRLKLSRKLKRGFLDNSWYPEADHTFPVGNIQPLLIGHSNRCCFCMFMLARYQDFLMSLTCSSQFLNKPACLDSSQTFPRLGNKPCISSEHTELYLFRLSVTLHKQSEINCKSSTSLQVVWLTTCLLTILITNSANLIPSLCRPKDVCSPHNHNLSKEHHKQTGCDWKIVVFSAHE